MPPSPRSSLATSFNAIAALYAAVRPGYPPELFAMVEEFAGRPLDGADVLDVGAGTGIATRLLAERGARVVAVEPGAGMAAELRSALPRIPLVRGDGEALPFADGVADVVTYAQSWHWTDPARSVPEAVRVLRPGGALALWWNVPDTDVPWLARQEARLAERCPAYRPPGFPATVAGLLAPFGLDTRSGTVRWSRTITVEDRLRTLGSHSYLAVMSAAEADAVLSSERVELLARFPDGVLVEPFVVDVTVALRGSAAVRG
ncbi:methyltransferase [Streptomyces violaceusniger]|uniref:Methyltransferase domain-containing protein n=2 Tax=Streptomyces violaceusniger group TaxID=2839105 RepID=A0ABD5JFY7_9ACTN|nr:class I SAM-dependent methyltransferase [Streptomyces violaceusniger]KUL48216.1 methyltransferase [Streptomyces violaceusniger]MEE4586497.1 methyltransferase domain-containing protein [Streptomyces sp. DSM 41602]